MSTVAVPNSFVAWFTAERRQQINLFFGSLAPLVILAGFATQEQTEQVLIIIGAVMQFVTSLLSLINVRKGDWGTAWAVIRGAIYGLATVVSPALVLLGLYNEETNASLLTGLSLSLAALSSLVAVFTSGKQQKEAIILAVKANGSWGLGEDLRQESKKAIDPTVLPSTPSQS